MSLTRRCLDQLLLDAAAAAGACVDTGVARQRTRRSTDDRVVGVRLARSRQATCLRAPVVIAADGRGSRTGRAREAVVVRAHAAALGVRRLLLDVTRMSARGEMHIRRGGYIGVAPLPGGLTNVSVVLDGPVAARPTPRRAEQQAIVRRARRAPTPCCAIGLPAPRRCRR